MRRDILTPAPGYRSPETGSFAAQLDTLTRYLLRDLRGIRAAELGWQPRPGMNTIGMLLAHIAIVEVFWTQVGPLRRTRYESESVLGIGLDDDGLPIPPGGKPPRGLRGKPLSYFGRLLSKGRAYLKRHAKPLTERDLARTISRTRRDGRRETYSLRWIYFHLVEHFAGHYGQILLLRHQYRDRRRGR